MMKELPTELHIGSTPEIKRKVFAKPFRVVFRKTSDQVVTWIRIESLDGLRNVCKRIGNGELVPVDSYSTLDRQLWGHLAEYIGFLRFEGPADDFSSGLQPAGPEFGSLAGDFSTLFGPDGALEALAEMRGNFEETAPQPEVVTGIYVKPDGVNLTPAGEDALAKIADITPLDQESENAITLTLQSEPGLTSEEMDAALNGTSTSDGARQEDQGADGLVGEPGEPIEPS